MNDNPRVRYIDAWRFYAIGLVIISHILEFSHSIYAEMLPGLIWRIHPLGPLGVYIFFCISGYVICRGMIKEVAIYGTLSLRDFYLRRVLRIAPPLLLYLFVLGVMLHTGMIETTVPQLIQSGLFLCNIDLAGQCGWYVGHTWSLAFEEQFYVVFPLIFVGMRIAAKRRKLLPVIGALLAAVVLAHLAQQAALADYLSMFGYMLWGCAFALYEDLLRPLLKRMPMALWCGLCALLIGVNFVALPMFLMEGIYPLVAPVIICAVVFGTPLHQPLVGKLFGHAWLTYLGQISYTIYLWQQVATADHGFTSPFVVFALLGGVVLLAHVSYQYVERPLIRLGRRWSSRRDDAVTPGVPIADARGA